jgi:hypothetical protein
MSELFFDTSMRVARRNTVDPLKRISSKMSQSKDLIGAPFVGLAEIFAESVRLPLENIGYLSMWSLRKMSKVLGSTLKLGLKTAMLIPLPLPGNQLSIARVVGDARAMRLSFEQKTLGSPERFSDIFARIRGIRKDAEQRTITAEPSPAAA